MENTWKMYESFKPQRSPKPWKFYQRRVPESRDPWSQCFHLFDSRVRYKAAVYLTNCLVA